MLTRTKKSDVLEQVEQSYLQSIYVLPKDYVFVVEEVLT